MELDVHIINRIVDPLQDELLRVFASLDTQGQTEVLACAYKELIRLKGLCGSAEEKGKR